MLRYNLNNMGNKDCEGNKAMIRKNIKHMNDNEVKYLKSKIKNMNNLKITYHAQEKELIPLKDIKEAIKNKRYQLIDYNYNISNQEERVMLRTKNKYQIKNINGKAEECYIKFVVSLTNKTVVTVWANKVIDEEYKQNNLKNRYYENFDIINKKVKL